LLLDGSILFYIILCENILQMFAAHFSFFFLFLFYRCLRNLNNFIYFIYKYLLILGTTDFLVFNINIKYKKTNIFKKYKQNNKKHKFIKKIFRNIKSIYDDKNKFKN